jgi:hypothetical protein
MSNPSRNPRVRATLASDAPCNTRNSRQPRKSILHTAQHHASQSDARFCTETPNTTPIDVTLAVMSNPSRNPRVRATLASDAPCNTMNSRQPRKSILHTAQHHASQSDARFCTETPNTTPIDVTLAVMSNPSRNPRVRANLASDAPCNTRNSRQPRKSILHTAQHHASQSDARFCTETPNTTPIDVTLAVMSNPSRNPRVRATLASDAPCNTRNSRQPRKSILHTAQHHASQSDAR